MPLSSRHSTSALASIPSACADSISGAIAHRALVTAARAASRRSPLLAHALARFGRGE
jgi:hypothetical protein